MGQTPERGPESELREAAAEQRSGRDQEDLLRDTEIEQAERDCELQAEGENKPGHP